MNDVVFIKRTGGLGRALPGEDYISGYLHYSATLPSGFNSGDRCKLVASIEEAEDLGIVDTHADGTAAQGEIEVTNKGLAGETITVTVITSAGTVTIASYTQVTADITSLTTSGDRLALEINAGTHIHGFSAVNTAGSVALAAPKSQGVFLNSGTPLVVTDTGTWTATLTQFTGGVASEIAIMHYHISEFFRMQPKGLLWVGIYATADATTFASVTLMQNIASGKIRQIGIYQKTTVFADSQCATLQAILDTNFTNHKPLEAIYQPDFNDGTEISALDNLRTGSSEGVSVCFGQDGAGVGHQLFLTTDKSIGCVGTLLGTVALAKVNECVAWVGKFNVATTEYDTLEFANGQVYTAVTDGNLTTLDSYGYIFLKKQIGKTGSWFNDSHTATVITDDYAYIELNRTVHKAIRGLRVYLLDFLASPLNLNSDGTLTDATVGFFEKLCANALDTMVRDRELSDYSVTIDPSQDVLSTSELVISVSLLPTGTARTITVNIGFETSV